MGLMLARVANSFSTPGARFGIGVAIGIPTMTAVTLSAQYGRGDDFDEPSGMPRFKSGSTLFVAGGLVGTGVALGNGMPRLAGVAAAAVGTTYLVTPALRRHMAEN